MYAIVFVIFAIALVSTPIFLPPVRYFQRGNQVAHFPDRPCEPAAIAGVMRRRRRPYRSGGILAPFPAVFDFPTVSVVYVIHLLQPKFAQFLVAQSAVQIHHECGVHVLLRNFAASASMRIFSLAV